MANKLIKIALIGNTNAGKSTLMNSMIDKTVSIINKKINTTQNIIMGIVNIDDTQIIFYDTPGSNFLNSSVSSQKRLKIDIWTAIDEVECILYIIDVSKYNYNSVCSDIKKINEVKKPIIVIFNKTDLIDNKLILPYIESLNNLNIVEAFFNISAKYRKGLNKLSIFTKSKAQNNKWIFNKGEISNKDNIFMANECTRNAILKYLHKEIPYNIIVRNLLFKSLNNLNLIETFFNISAKYRKGLKKLSIFIKSKAKNNKWIFNKGEVSNKDPIFMANECTRNAILKYLHKEIPYNITVRNLLFKSLNNNDIKIKQSIDLTNMRYKPIILGNKGETIKKIRECSQNEISNIMKSKIHLYLQVNKLND